MRALVTGATGFIGSLLCEELANRDVDVRVLARNPGAFSPSHPKIATLKGDLSDFESLSEALEGVELVFHLAGLTSAVRSRDYFRTNADGTLNLLRAVDEKVRAGQVLRRFVHVSSLAAGAPSITLKPHTEFDPSAPASDYGKSKKAGEDHALSFRGRFPVVVVRPPMVFGPRDKQFLALAKIVKKGLVVEVAGSNPERTKFYSMIYVRDLVDGLLQAAFASAPSSESHPVYYLAHPSIYSYDQILNEMMKTIGVRATRIKVPFVLARAVAWCLHGLSLFTGKAYPMNPDKLHDLKPDYWICSVDRARKDLGFNPQYDLERGMKETIQWYIREGWL